MSKAGSTAAGIIVSVLIVASVGVLGYYQFAIAPNITTPSSSAVTTPPNITTVRINITVGAATKTTDAYAPNPLRLVIGKNTSVIFSLEAGYLELGSRQARTSSSTIAESSREGSKSLVATSTSTTLTSTSTTLTSTSTTLTSTMCACATSRTTTSSRQGPIKNVNVTILKGAASNMSLAGFSPDNINEVLGVNNTVTWTNDDKSPHTPSSMGEPCNSGNPNQGHR